MAKSRAPFKPLWWKWPSTGTSSLILHLQLQTRGSSDGGPWCCESTETTTCAALTPNLSSGGIPQGMSWPLTPLQTQTCPMACASPGLEPWTWLSHPVAKNTRDCHVLSEDKHPHRALEDPQLTWRTEGQTTLSGGISVTQPDAHFQDDKRRQNRKQAFFWLAQVVVWHKRPISTYTLTQQEDIKGRKNPLD